MNSSNHGGPRCPSCDRNEIFGHYAGCLSTLESLRAKRDELRPKMFRDTRGSHDSAAFQYGGNWCYPRLYDAAAHHEHTYCECELCSDRGDEGPRLYYDDEIEEEQ